MRRPKVKQPDGSSERTISEKKRDIKQIDKTILDNFYKLVNSQGHVRLTAALSTFKILTTMGRNNTEKFNEHLNYCIERLVAGLASPRAFARQGYAMLLMELLSNFQVSTKKLLTIARDKFGELKKQTKDNLVGYYLLVTIILESGNWNKWNADKGPEYAEKLYEILEQLRNSKSYFEFSTNKLLVRYYDVFQPYMKVDILDHLADPPISALGKRTHTHLTDSLFLNCSPNTLEAYLGKLIDTFNRPHTPQTRKVYALCAKQMAQLVRRLPSDLSPASDVINEHESTKRIGKFLVANCLLYHVHPTDRPEGTVSRVHWELHNVPGSFWSQHNVFKARETLFVSTKKALDAALHATLDHIVSTCHAKVRLELMRELIDFADDLIRKYKAVRFSGPDKSGEKWEKYMTCLKKHTELVAKKEDPSILFPITSLYYLYGLQILEYGFECQEMLSELATSAKEALKDDPNDGSWADILTDQIIAILSATECNPWIRRLCVSIFGALLSHISETSIDLICDVFTKMPFGDDDGDGDGGSLSGDEEEEEEEDGEGSDAMEGVEEEGEDEWVDAEEGDDDGGTDDDTDDDDCASDVSNEADRLPEDSEEESSPDGIGAKSESRLGKENEEEESEEEEYMDDEQMMKLDAHLAEMFREKRIGKRKDPSFQLRCLDLVKKIIQKKHSDGELIRKVLATIVPFANKCRRHKETRVLAEKIHSIIPKKKGAGIAPVPLEPPPSE